MRTPYARNGTGGKDIVAKLRKGVKEQLVREEVRDPNARERKRAQDKLVRTRTKAGLLTHQDERTTQRTTPTRED